MDWTTDTDDATAATTALVDWMDWTTGTDELTATAVDEAAKVARTVVEAAGVETTLEAVAVTAADVSPDEAPSNSAGPGIV
jgi:hypothetical protein